MNEDNILKLVYYVKNLYEVNIDMLSNEMKDFVTIYKVDVEDLTPLQQGGIIVHDVLNTIVYSIERE